MDEIEKRLRDSTDACIKSFENWVKENKSLDARELLMETMHEVRKVISRVEIEIAISERDRLGSRPIPIPAHRSQRKRPGEAGDEAMDMDDFNEGNDIQPHSNAGGHDQPRRQHQNNRPRRPMHGRSGGGGGQGGGGGNGNNGNNNSDNQPQ